MLFKWSVAVVAVLASATAFAQDAQPVTAPATVESSAPAAQPVTPGPAASANAKKAYAAKQALWIAGSVALGALIISDINESSDDRPSSP